MTTGGFASFVVRARWFIIVVITVGVISAIYPLRFLGVSVANFILTSLVAALVVSPFLKWAVKPRFLEPPEKRRDEHRSALHGAAG
jgi:hypothetical protein